MKTKLLQVVAGIIQFAVALLLGLMPQAAGADDKTEIVIGAVNSVTGKLSPAGAEIRWAYEQAAADINAQGGIFLKQYQRKLPVRLVIGDDESDAAIAAKVTERLIVRDKVDLLLGTHTSDLMIPSIKMSDRHRVYHHAVTCFNPVFLQHHFVYATNLWFDIEQATEVPFRVFESLPPQNKPQRHALIMEDSPDGAFFGGLFRKSAAKFGYSFQVDERLPDNFDYLPLILHLKEQGIEAILIFGDPGNCITFVRQMKQANFHVKYLHGWKGTWNNEFWQALQQDAQYVVSDGFWSEDYPYPGAKRLGELFFQRFGKRSVSAGFFYSGCQILFQAIEAAGSLDAARLRQAVINTPFTNTLIGEIRYAANGIATFESTANQWWNGELKWFYPFKDGAWQLRLMPLWDQRSLVPSSATAQ